MSFEYAIQTAIYTKLAATPALTALLATTTSIYDNVPQAVDSGDESVFPYITIGDDTAVLFGTDDVRGSESTLTLHTWAKSASRRQVKQIQGEIYAALHDFKLVVLNYNTLLCLWEFSESFLDADGETTHGVQRFRIILQEA